MTRTEAAPTVTKSGKSVTYRNIADRARRQFGFTRPGSVARGQHALVEPGKRIVLWGTGRGCKPGVVGPVLVAYRHEFRIGDTAVCGGFNLTYTGTIVAIGEKTVTVEERVGSSQRKLHRMSIYCFSQWNDDFDLSEICRRNAEWRD